jgi:5-formyltetrahydrofolate cyclo-ligase
MADAKRTVRRERLAARRDVPPAVRAARDAAIVATLRILPELAGAGDLLLYAALPGEPDLDALLGDPPPGARVLLPRVEGDRIVAVPHRPGTPLAPGALGVREPTGAAVALDVLDAVVLPGVAFDATGWRLGRGGGHYDRLLAAVAGRAVAVGVTHEDAVLPTVPREPHDRPVDVLVTDASVRRRDADAGPGRA